MFKLNLGKLNKETKIVNGVNGTKKHVSFSVHVFPLYRVVSKLKPECCFIFYLMGPWSLNSG